MPAATRARLAEQPRSLRRMFLLISSWLTEEVVLDWIKAIVVGGYEEHVNGMIAKQIADKAVTEQSMPWAPPAAEAPAVPAAPTA